MLDGVAAYVAHAKNAGKPQEGSEEMQDCIFTARNAMRVLARVGGLVILFIRTTFCR
jgi:hypothetical protein